MTRSAIDDFLSRSRHRVTAPYFGATEVTDPNTSVGSAGDLTATRSYTFGGASVAVQVSDGTSSAWSLVLGDLQGSATVMMGVTLDASGAMAPASLADPVARNAYTPYGAVRGADNLPTDHGWLNQVTDEASTGLVYLNARYYDPEASRFVSPDPLLKPMDPRTLDAYRYAENNPISYTDGNGMCSTNGNWAYVGGVLEPPCNEENGAKWKGIKAPRQPDWNHGDSGWQLTGGGATRHAPADPSVLNYLASQGIHMNADGSTLCETQKCLDSGANYWAPGAAADGGWRDKSSPGDKPDPLIMFVIGDDIDQCSNGSGWFMKTAGCVSLGMNFIPGVDDAKWGFKGLGKLGKWVARIFKHGDEIAEVRWGVDALSKSGSRTVSGDLTRAGQELAKHSGEGGFPVAVGAPGTISRVGQQQLDDILTDPGTVIRDIAGGNFKGGKYYIAPDGRGAAFDSSGVFQYFGVFNP